mgnify:FL=1
MKGLMYFYLLVGCYVAHRRTATLDANTPEFLKTYLKIMCTYPKELINKVPSFKKKEPDNSEQQ